MQWWVKLVLHTPWLHAVCATTVEKVCCWPGLMACFSAADMQRLEHVPQLCQLVSTTSAWLPYGVTYCFTTANSDPNNTCRGLLLMMEVSLIRMGQLLHATCHTGCRMCPKRSRHMLNQQVKQLCNWSTNNSATSGANNSADGLRDLDCHRTTGRSNGGLQVKRCTPAAHFANRSSLGYCQGTSKPHTLVSQQPIWVLQQQSHGTTQPGHNAQNAAAGTAPPGDGAAPPERVKTLLDAP